jgi:inorganic pyrophosphatase
MINDHKEDSTKQMNKLRKLIQKHIKKFSNMYKKFSKEIEVLKKWARSVRNENHSKSNKNTVESIMRRLDQAEQSISDWT